MSYLFKKLTGLFSRRTHSPRFSAPGIPRPQSPAQFDHTSSSWHWTILLERAGVATRTDRVVIFDVGAHFGESVLRFRERWPLATIYCFEPFPESFEKLKSVVGDADKVHIFPLAIAAQPGQRKFYPTNYSAANSLLEIDPAINHWADSDDFCNQDSEIVQAETLDRFAAENGIAKINLLKMDIQGGELEALKGATDLLSRQAIDAIVSEVEFTPLYKEQVYCWDIASYLLEYRYHFVNFVELKESDAGVLRWADALFVSDGVWQTIQNAHQKGNWVR